MVGSQPAASLLVATHIPDRQLVGNVLIAPCAQSLLHRYEPLVGFQVKGIDITRRDDPQMATGVKTGLTFLIADNLVFVQIVVLPHNTVCLLVEAEDVAVVRRQIKEFVVLGKARHTDVVIELLVTIAERIMLQLRVLEIDMPEALVQGLHPVVLLVIDIDTLYTAFDASLGQDALRMAVTLLGTGIEDGIVHALAQPQAAVAGLIDLVDIVVAQRHGVLHLRIIGLKAIAVITVQTVWRADPHEALGVA